MEKELQQLIQKGLDHFDLMFGIVSKIDNDLYKVVVSIAPDDAIKPGDVFDLKGTYCNEPIRKKKVVSFHHCAIDENINTHPAYRDFGLESYIGAPIFIGNNIYGTINFSSPLPRNAFQETDLIYVENLAKEAAKIIQTHSS